MKVSSEDSKFGLKEDWFYVQETLERIVPIYDKTNRYISLGTDLKLREEGIDLLLRYKDSNLSPILDLGCGTGKMSIELLFRAPEMADSIILVDPLRSMIRFARSKEKLECALSVFENLPFKDSSVGAAMAGFSIRDARSLLHAFREIARLLRDDGKLLVVDLSKPDSDAKSSLISFYWHVIAPFIALVSSGKLGLRFGALSRTFQRLPKNSEFIKLAKRAGFTVTKARYSMLGGACVILFRKEPQDPGFRTHPD